jgi:hypothetical protein
LILWKRLSFKDKLSLCFVVIGEIFLFSPCITGFVFAEFRLPKTELTFLRSLPDLSYVIMVFSKVAGSALLTMASISACCSSIPLMM